MPLSKYRVSLRHSKHLGSRRGGVVFVQLPPPRFSLRESPTNIPLAAGFISAALKSHDLGSLELHILDSDEMDLSADRAIIRTVVDREPTVVAMTLYVWNAVRSLFVASEIKKVLPATKILVGGPEVTADNDWLRQHPAVDAGVFGEGESRIGAMLQALFHGVTERGIAGGFFKRDGGEMLLNASLPAPFDLSSITYPYLDATIGPSRDGTLFVETVRGCPFRCRYCYYHKTFHGVRPHLWKSVQQVLDFAYSEESGVREIYLMDPTFNARPGFRKLLKSMIARRAGDIPVLHTELRADLVSREDVVLLKEAGAASVEVGLQTTNQEALRIAGRKEDLGKMARGSALLKEAGIEVTTGVIVGLPGDTPEGFSNTVKWLRRTGAYSVVHPFVLSVLPGTDFRSRAGQLGLKYQPRPPYHVVETSTFSPDAIRGALLECEDVFGMELDHVPLPSLVDSGAGVVTELPRAEHVTKWIVDPLHDRRRNVLSVLIPLATDPFTFWFRGRGGPDAERSALALLDLFARENPHTVTAVVTEFEKLPAPTFFQKILDVVAQPGIYANLSFHPLREEGEVVTPLLVLLVPNPRDSSTRERLRESYAPTTLLVWDMGLPQEEEVAAADTPLLISVPGSMDVKDLKWLFELLKSLHGDNADEVLFRDAQLQHDWSSLTGLARLSAPAESIILTVF